jgi:SAM-dependent methyltransferase
LTLLPLGEVELEGHRLPAPADPPAMLEAAYGPGWRLPDPAFVPDIPRSTVRRVNEWVRSAMTNRKYWYGLYGGSADALPTGPSPFAKWFAGREAPGSRVVDLGSGNGRDAVWLARQGHHVRGYDFVPRAASLGQRLARQRGVEVEFHQFNLYDLRHVLTLGGLLAHEPEPVHLYARFLLHAVSDLGVRNVWLLARTGLRRGGRLYLEFVAPDPRGRTTQHAFGEHSRNPLDPAAVTAQIEGYGGRVEHQETGRGLAVYKNDDPYVCRMVVRWSR